MQSLFLPSDQGPRAMLSSLRSGQPKMGNATTQLSPHRWEVMRVQVRIIEHTTHAVSRSSTRTLRFGLLRHDINVLYSLRGVLNTQISSDTRYFGGRGPWPSSVQREADAQVLAFTLYNFMARCALTVSQKTSTCLIFLPTSTMSRSLRLTHSLFISSQ